MHARLWRTLFGFGLFGCVLVTRPRAALASETESEAQLHREAERAWVWRRNWSLISAGLTLGSFAAVPLAQRDSRPDFIVSGISSGLTLASTWFWPLRVESADEELQALPLSERSAALPRLWRESAEDEQSRVSWPWHLLNIGLSAGAGGIIAFGYRHYASGAVTAGVSATLGEIQLFTQPLGLTREQRQGSLLVPAFRYAARNGAEPESFCWSLAGIF